jgi:hypothetical protein
MKKAIDEAEWFPVMVIAETIYETDIVVDFTPEFLDAYEKVQDSFEWIQSCLRAAWDSHYDEEERKEDDSPD